MSNWQPIATAPKDGTRIDLWVVWPAYDGKPRTERRMAVCLFDPVENDWDVGDYYLGQYMAKPFVTHWMPIPDGPEPSP